MRRILSERIEKHGYPAGCCWTVLDKRCWCRRICVAGGLPVPVLAKCEHLNPGGSVKDRLAKAIVAYAEQYGQLRPGRHSIEAGQAATASIVYRRGKWSTGLCAAGQNALATSRDALLGARVYIADNAPLHWRNFQQWRLARRKTVGF